MKYCRTCGKQINENAVICVSCGCAVSRGINYQQSSYDESYSDKNKITAGLLQIFLGSFGVGRFYMGNTLRGLMHIILTIIGLITYIGGYLVFIFGFFGMDDNILNNSEELLFEMMSGSIISFFLMIVFGILLCIASYLIGLIDGILILCSKDAKDSKGKKLRD